MKRLIQLEEAAMFGVCFYALYFFDAGWWIYLLLFLGPDISMIGYLAGNKTGAILYNFFHHKAIGAACFLAGFIFQNYGLEIAGVVLFGHSCMDRMFGYGLKYFKGFKFTHLGQIGRSASNTNN